MRRYSANQFATACATPPDGKDATHQAQAMEQINADLVDIINQVIELADDSVIQVPLRNVDDVKSVVCQAMSALRVYVASTDGVDVNELKEQIKDLEQEVADLEEELDECVCDY